MGKTRGCEFHERPPILSAEFQHELLKIWYPTAKNIKYTHRHNTTKATKSLEIAYVPDSSDRERCVRERVSLSNQATRDRAVFVTFVTRYSWRAEATCGSCVLRVVSNRSDFCPADFVERVFVSHDGGTDTSTGTRRAHKTRCRHRK